MKNLSRNVWLAFLVLLASPLVLSWLPAPAIESAGVLGMNDQVYVNSLFASFRELSVTLVATLAVAMLLTVALGYVSVLRMRFGRAASSVLNGIESIPAILVALFCYAPVSGYLARHTGGASQAMSLLVFIMAATVTVLPEAVRAVAIPLTDLYNRKYSLSFRSYGFTKRRILLVLMKTAVMRDTIKRIAAGVLLKTLVLDCSFGFIIQLGFGSYGTPAHLSPGALIAANRDALFEGGNPVLFWVPSLLLVAISTAFLLTLNDRKEAAK
jgi:ABC-type dipeptide/oligopeptide/nickel transport system permease subunit